MYRRCAIKILVEPSLSTFNNIILPMTLHLSPSHLLVTVFLFSSLFTIFAAPGRPTDRDPVTLELCSDRASRTWFLKVSPTVIFQAVEAHTGQLVPHRGRYIRTSETKCVDVGTVCWAATTGTPKKRETSHNALLAIEATSSFDYVGKGLRYLLDSEVWEVNSDSWKQGDQDSYLKIGDEYLEINSPPAALELCHYPRSISFTLKLGATAFHAVADRTGRMKIAETRCSSQTKRINLGTVHYGELAARQAKSQVHAKLLAIEATSEFDFVGKGLHYLLGLNIWDPNWQSWMEGDHNSYSEFYRGYLANIDYTDV
ncbi:hypothetical protein F5890DRAFT_668443 [Lentinula detonsa]|uniref:Uncharacterized protein n=1 Tax=Lentinula detonsa TaxID=2804962 RepID=A0AA38PS58_9AGAR|nr:hypothetical protein F5890DRAFT_668443 [Lentinula detonsa]